jgi:hypothetical protein
MSLVIRTGSMLMLAGALALATGCQAVADDDGPGAADDGSDGSDGTDDGTTDDGTDDGTGDDDGGTVAGPCTSGVLFAGSPTYLGDEQPDPGGTGLLDEPPVRFRHLVFDGSTLYTDTGEELWAADMSAASPQAVRVAGERQVSGTSFQDGPCAAARMSNTHGMARLPDGSLVVADHGANALVAVADPAGPACAVSYLAGTAEPIESVPPDEFPNEGDTDGPGATAQLRGPSWPVADDQGNVFFVDGGNRKVKVVAPDAAHTVSTVADLSDLEQDTWPGMTFMAGKLYLVGLGSSSVNVVLEVDPATGAKRAVREGPGAAFPPVEENNSPVLSSITHNGTDLYVSGKGYIWKLSPDGTLTYAAGTGFEIDFPPDGYDPAAEHPADELVLRYSQGGTLFEGAQSFMTYDSGEVYWTGRDDDVLVEKISCE